MGSSTSTTIKSTDPFQRANDMVNKMIIEEEEKKRKNTKLCDRLSKLINKVSKVSIENQSKVLEVIYLNADELDFLRTEKIEYLYRRINAWTTLHDGSNDYDANVARRIREQLIELHDKRQAAYLLGRAEVQSFANEIEQKDQKK